VGIGLAISLFPGDTTPLQSIIGMACGGGSLLLIGKIAELALKKEEAMGGGDIKLMAAVGALWGWQVSLLSIMLGSCVGAVVGTGLLAFRSLGKDHKIPFGPFLAIGVWVAVLWGDGLIRWYMGLLQNAAM
jgi:leader peptidase (prepilin peptidase)/N-methyltransferase